MNKERVLDRYELIHELIGNRFIRGEITYDTYIKRTDELVVAMDKKYRLAGKGGVSQCWQDNLCSESSRLNGVAGQPQQGCPSTSM